MIPGFSNGKTNSSAVSPNPKPDNLLQQQYPCSHPGNPSKHGCLQVSIKKKTRFRSQKRLQQIVKHLMRINKDNSKLTISLTIKKKKQCSTICLKASALSSCLAIIKTSLGEEEEERGHKPHQYRRGKTKSSQKVKAAGNSHQTILTRYKTLKQFTADQPKDQFQFKLHPLMPSFCCHFH